MSLKKSITVLLILLPSLSSSAEFRDVPEKLFSIELGRTYVIGDPEGKDIGSIPVKKFAGIKQFMGNGIYYYFYPKDEDNTLEYLGKNDKAKDLKDETEMGGAKHRMVPKCKNKGRGIQLGG